MIVFFDTCIYVDLFSRAMSATSLQESFGHYIIRVSPIVLHELYRGARSKRDRRVIDRLATQLLRIEPPSWERAWLTSGRLLTELFPDHEAIGLARLQNDLLLALTARGQGALLVSRDQHLADMQKLFPFRLALI